MKSWQMKEAIHGDINWMYHIHKHKRIRQIVGLTNVTDNIDLYVTHIDEKKRNTIIG